MLAQIIDEPIAKKKNIGLSRDILRKAEKDPSCLGEARCVISDAILKLDWEGIGRVLLVELSRGCERIGKMCHFCS